VLLYLYWEQSLAYSGQRKIAFDTGFNDALFGRDRDNPYDASVVLGSWTAYEEGYESGLLSDVPPRGPRGEQGEEGAAGSPGIDGGAGSDGADGNTHYVGNGAPAGGLGSDGDIYTDADNGDIYEKVTGSWSLQGSPGSLSLTIRSDTIDPSVFPEVTYRGDALPGVATSAASWRVQQLTMQSDGDLAILFADGNDNFDNIWDNRLSLSYS
jgi:hypothetical protein